MKRPKPDAPQTAQRKTRHNLSPFWLLPLVALLIAGWLWWKNAGQEGRLITIAFNAADGIVPGRTPVRYQGVQVGLVREIHLSKDLKTIEITASIQHDMAGALREDTQFWLVTPQASLAGVSGLDALVGGNYIGMAPGYHGKPQTRFRARDSQPKYQVANGELMLHLLADDLGALNIGSRVYYRKIPVGRVYDYHIAPGGKGVVIDILINRRYTALVKKESRFWNVSGLRAQLGLNGAQFDMESLAALINGAVAFDSPLQSPPAAPDMNFTLYADLASSRRGVTITLDLPDGQGLQAGRTPLLYQGLEVGKLTDLTLEPSGKVRGELVLDPSVRDLMRQGTRIERVSPHFSLQSPNLGQLLKGSYLALYPGPGEPRSHFTVLADTQALRQQANTLLIELIAAESYGIQPGQPLTLKGITVGKVLNRRLVGQQVVFEVGIAGRYRHFIHRDSQFIVRNRLDINLGADGLNVRAASPAEWAEGGIRVQPGRQGAPARRYPLYADQERARQGVSAASAAPDLFLQAARIDGLQRGSVVLYRQFQVGEVTAIQPDKQGFRVGISLLPVYRHLLSAHSVFWIEGGARVQLNGNGLNVDAAPLSRTLKGAVSFDNLPEVTVAAGAVRPLWPDENRARAAGQTVLLRTASAAKLRPGTPVRWRGVDIGQVAEITLTPDQRAVQASVLLAPRYRAQFARQGARFVLITPVISAGGIDHLETLVQPYIDARPGTGKTQYAFTLYNEALTDPRYVDGVRFIVDAPEAGSLQMGTPVLYRGVEVGKVSALQLNQFADRVQITLRIDKAYAHLIRINTQFWLDSGYDIRFGLFNGLAVRSGTFRQFVAGGIAFATPPSVPLAPAAQAGKHFLLLDEAPKEWRQWRTAIPPR